MKFIYRIIISLSVLMSVFIAVWGIFFFRAIESEVNDETDDMLEDYSADIIMKWLSGVNIPSTDNGSNNTYYIRRVTPDYAASTPHIRYENEMIYIVRQGEMEAARIRHQVFMDEDEKFYELTVAVPTFERRELINAVLWWVIFLYAVMLVAGLGITAGVVNYNLKPLKALLKWIDSYVPGRKNVPVPCDTDIIEIKTLADAAQSAVDRVERQYELQNQFIGNASHELQTPLAVCAGRVEMLLDSDTLSQEQAEELVKINRSLQGMIKLNRTLLLMTKIDNGQFMDVSDVDLYSLVCDGAAMFDEIYASKGVKSRVSGVTSLVVRMNEQLSSILVSNLLKNAFMHSPAGSVVDISVGQDGFRISNAGDSPLDSERIFDRFYQGNGRKEGSTGLGLALVKSVCDRYSFRIGYMYDGRHNFIVEINAR